MAFGIFPRFACCPLPHSPAFVVLVSGSLFWTISERLDHCCRGERDRRATAFLTHVLTRRLLTTTAAVQFLGEQAGVFRCLFPLNDLRTYPTTSVGRVPEVRFRIMCSIHSLAARVK